jgi:hypothetical protein
MCRQVRTVAGDAEQTDVGAVAEGEHHGEQASPVSRACQVGNRPAVQDPPSEDDLLDLASHNANTKDSCNPYEAGKRDPDHQAQRREQQRIDRPSHRTVGNPDAKKEDEKQRGQDGTDDARLHQLSPRDPEVHGWYPGSRQGA